LLLLYFVPAAAYLYYLKSSKQASPIELIIALVTIILTAYLTMMVVGSFFRGEGMQLIV
jgi:hypothetical protein